MATNKLTLKLLVDKKANKVLFAEANKDFVDFLLSLMSVPLGSVISLLSKQKMVGCLGDLYESIENLSKSYMQPKQNKDSILKRNAAHFAANAGATLLISDDRSSPAPAGDELKHYRCSGSNCNYITNVKGYTCPGCSYDYDSDDYYSCPMEKEVTFVGPTNAPVTAAPTTTGGDDGGFVKGVVTYMVMDNLAVMPMSSISSITMLNKFNVHDVSVLEEKVVDLGMEEGLKLLEASFQSKTVLTDVFLAKKAK